MRRGNDDVDEDPFRIDENRDTGEQNSDHRSDDMPAEFFDVIDERHFSRIGGIALFEEFGKQAHAWLRKIFGAAKVS